MPLRAVRSDFPQANEKGRFPEGSGPLALVVSRARVELARRSHCHLKTACLPIPPPRRTRRLLLESGKECKQKFRKILFVTKRPRNGFDILPRLRRGIPIGSDSNEPHHRRVPASTRAPEPFPLHRLTRGSVKNFSHFKKMQMARQSVKVFVLT